MSLYICIGIIHFLCKSRKIESFLPILLGVCGFLMLIVEPMSLGWDGKMAELSYMDGKGLIPAMFISILTADLYCYMRKRDFGKISLPGYGASFPFRCICLHRAGGGADGNLYSIVRHNE